MTDRDTPVSRAREKAAAKQARVDALIDGFDQARLRLRPTNGECAAVFAVLLADILQEAPDDVGEAIYERCDAVLRSGAQDREALLRLFETCGLPIPNRKPRQP